MTIEIQKTGFINKGAELMLYAILEKLKSVYPKAEYAMAPNIGQAPYLKRAELKLLQKASLWRYGIQWGDLFKLAPNKIRQMYGVILDNEIDVVLDAAGFAYGDIWGTELIEEAAHSCRRWKRRGTKVIFMPQAFGPFSSNKIKKKIKIVADNADLIMARDSISYDLLTNVVGIRDNIKMYPDFTNILLGVVPEYFNPETMRYCIVPNYRMLDKTSSKVSGNYIDFLLNCVEHLRKRKVNPFILIHENNKDKIIADEINNSFSKPLPIITEDNPLLIKGILGTCEGTVGSRFHGLVNALSQGVPSLATGWSHKYEMLFRDYGFDEGIVDINDNKESIQNKIDMIVDKESNQAIKRKLKSKSAELKVKTESMWDLVFDTIGTES